MPWKKLIRDFYEQKGKQRKRETENQEEKKKQTKKDAQDSVVRSKRGIRLSQSKLEEEE